MGGNPIFSSIEKSTISEVLTILLISIYCWSQLFSILKRAFELREAKRLYWGVTDFSLHFVSEPLGGEDDFESKSNSIVRVLQKSF